MSFRLLTTGLMAAFTSIAFTVAAPRAATADKTVTVHFTPGSSSTTIKGAVQGYDSVDYLLDAGNGQAIAIDFKPTNASCYFNLFEPHADEAIFNGSLAGDNSYADTLKLTGTYKAEVYQMRSEARRGTTCGYTITFKITG